MRYVGIDWANRPAAWCALGESGSVNQGPPTDTPIGQFRAEHLPNRAARKLVADVPSLVTRGRAIAQTVATRSVALLTTQ
jgi:hypothetical protein